MDCLTWILAGVFVFILGSVLVTELGTDFSTWITTLNGMTPKKWTIAEFVAISDLTSLIYVLV